MKKTAKTSYDAIILLLVVFVFCLPLTVRAQPRATVKFSTIREENPEGVKNAIILPYALSTESLGFTVGIGGATKGYIQDQLLVAATAFASVDEAAAVFGGMWDYELFSSDRFFFTAFGSLGYYPRQRTYSSPFFLPNVTRPGSNDSGKDDFIESGGNDHWLDMKVEYVLPIGAAKDNGIRTQRLKGGMLQSLPNGGQTWNPLQSGTTVLMLRQYNRARGYETNSGDFDEKTHPFELGLLYNNTDFPMNPSYGSSQYLSVTHDFGWSGSDTDWTFMEFEASKYFSLGSSDRAKQRVAAFNVWTGHCLSWTEGSDQNGNVVVRNGPPTYEGATLGGLYRMRAYPSYRFNDRSSVYATAEYRYTPHWNPLGEISWLDFLQVDWWQFVGFVEGGRVANNYDLSDLSRDWKGDVGFGIRSMMAGGVVRIDVAFSDEDVGIWFMAGHPF